MNKRENGSGRVWIHGGLTFALTFVALFIIYGFMFDDWNVVQAAVVAAGAAAGVVIGFTLWNRRHRE